MGLPISGAHTLPTRCPRCPCPPLFANLFALALQCRYIMQKYMDEIIELIMVEATEREVCEQLRFCW